MSGAEDVEVAPSQVGASLGIGALSGLLLAAAALVLGIVPWYELGPALATVLVVLALAFAYLTSLSANALGRRGRMAAALALVGFAPVLGHFALRTLQTPLFAQPVRGAAEATSGVLVALLCMSAAGAAAWWWATRRRAPRGPWLHAGALAAVGACGALVACAAFDARRLPAPETYTDSLPLVASLPGEESREAFSEVRPRAYELDAKAFALGRSCIAGKCFVHVRRSDHVRGLGPRVDQSADLSLHLDDEAETIVLVADGRAVAVASSALDRWDWSVPSPASIAARVSPPRSFIALAVVALLGALLGLSWRRRLTQRLELVSAGRGGVIDAFGWAHPDDGTPPHRVGRLVEAGPVVLLGKHPRASAYRGGRRDERVPIERGPRRAVMAQLRLAAATADAAICGWVLALSAPLAVAALIGLLS
jgi:hypothetical protein